MFGAVAYKMMPNLVITKSLRVGLAAIPFLLWAAYQYLLMVYSGRD